MIPDRQNADRLRDELLAAFVDGELTATERLDVEAWLARDAAAAALVEGQREVCQLSQTSQPPEPTAASWARTLAAIEAALSLAAAGPSLDMRPLGHPALRPAWRTAVLRWAGGAAAVFLVLFLNPLAPQPEPFPVTATEDVDILTLHAADADRLVVGDLPLRDPLNLAIPGDVVVVSAKPDVDGMVPYLRINADNPAPMVVVPLGTETGK